MICNNSNPVNVNPVSLYGLDTSVSQLIHSSQYTYMEALLYEV